ncbi:fatty acyl-AMP ligase [uncultured Nostoc sp.]|uniref:fatty acyl-AMP ligase n=1 Tax=uncultured Nostoc sp. TaxID=340711 RepID=UPI0035CB3C37
MIPYEYKSSVGECNFINLIELLQYRAVSQPHQTAYTFLVDGETEEISITYQQLDEQARSLAVHLQLLNANDERVLLLYQPGLEYIIAFFGCLYAGVVAVPAYPPRFNKPMPRLQAIVADAQAKFALTTTSILSNLERQLSQNQDLAALHWLATDSIANDLIHKWEQPQINNNTLAFLQYTSGSTGNPKGVMVSHSNLLHNSALIKQCFQHNTHSQGVIWLPPYHDMGLIGGIIQPLYSGFPVTLIAPVFFLQKPFRWLQAISRYKATTSGGPNFAYDLCVRKITPEQIESLDLSSWDVAFNGAETVRTETLKKFAATFEPCGFRREAFYPCYGMAETTLLVSGGLKTEVPIVRHVNGVALEQNRVEASSKENARTIVSCGQVWSNQVVIVDLETLTQCPFDRVGEIWVSSLSVANGYWNKPLETERNFHAYLGTQGPFLRTGDLGFLQDDQLFVTGRIKDVIIIRGRNYYPQDIEQTVSQSHAALQADGSAAFSVEINDEERLVVVQEVERNYLRKLNAQEVLGSIRQAVAEQHELQVFAVVLVKPGSIAKTSSGKIQRYACRTGFLSGTLDAVEDWSEHPQGKAKFIHLNAEVESLLQQLQNSKSSRLTELQ